MRYLFLFAVTLTLAACKTEYEGQEVEPLDPNRAVPVEIVTLRPSTDPLPIAAGGTVNSKEEARLSFKIGGIIDRIYVREGDRVRRGQLLAELKSTEIDAQSNKARRALEKIDRDLERVRALYADSAATLENVQDLETAREVAASDLQIAGFNQQYANIQTPITGRVARRMAEPGELVGPGTPVLYVLGEGAGGYVLRVGISDRDVLRLRSGDPAEVRLDAYPEAEPLAARVTEIAPAADPRTGTFEVELTLNPGGRTLRSGFIGRATIYPSNQPAYYRIPLDALVEGNGRHVTLYQPSPTGRAVRREVPVTRLEDAHFIIPTTALPTAEPGSAGEQRIITTGAAYLTPDAPYQASPAR